jgi:molybdopterin-binding protein
MSLLKFGVTIPHEMSSVLTTQSVKDIRLAPGDDIELMVKAIHELPVRD